MTHNDLYNHDVVRRDEPGWFTATSEESGQSSVGSRAEIVTGYICVYDGD